MAPFNLKARKMVSGRRGLFADMRRTIPSNRPVVWFHAASLGEFEQGRPLIEAWKTNRPDDFILLTFFSPSGYEIRKNFECVDSVCYLPFDGPKRMNRFIEIVNPILFILVKYEFWPNLLFALQRHRVPVFLISALFRPNQHFFKGYGAYFRRLLGVFTQIFVQDKQSASLLRGAPSMGNT